MPINKITKQNRTNYNDWRKAWQDYQSSPEYKNLYNWLDNTQGYTTGNPLDAVDGYINNTIPLVMKADSISRANNKGLSALDFEVPSFSDKGSIVSDFKNIPLEDKKALIKMAGDTMLDKEAGTTKPNIDWTKVFSNFLKNPKMLKYLPLAKRMHNTFGENFPDLYPDAKGNNMLVDLANATLKYD